MRHEYTHGSRALHRAGNGGAAAHTSRDEHDQQSLEHRHSSKVLDEAWRCGPGATILGALDAEINWFLRLICAVALLRQRVDSCEALAARAESVFNVAYPAFAASQVCGAPDMNDDRYNIYPKALANIDRRIAAVEKVQERNTLVM